MIPGIDCCDCCHIMEEGNLTGLKAISNILQLNDYCHTLHTFPGLPYQRIIFL